MNETASIINNITPRSLITSWMRSAAARQPMMAFPLHGALLNIYIIQHHAPKTFFATHYHELNELENKLPRVKNYHITNKEIGNKIIFLRKLAPGGSTHSFGIHVARMAGMPPALIQRANEILKTTGRKKCG